MIDNQDKADLFSGRSWLMMIPLIFSVEAYAGAQDNLVMRGALVAEACAIAPGDDNIQLDFSSVADQYLYTNQRTRGQHLELRLTECDPELYHSLRITFRGTENANLPGLLALSAGSKASGFAIGLETPKGKALPLNKPGEKNNLQSGTNIITFKAFVQGEPQALMKREITRGPFNAMATISLEYE